MKKRSECTCECHTEGITIIHCMPCCDGGTEFDKELFDKVLDDLPMSKELAILAMRNGEKVTHRDFAFDEWMQESGDRYEFEDGCLCDFDEFWRYRNGELWEGGWKIYH